MKVLTGYLDRASDLERLAADEGHSTFKIQLLTQAAAYDSLQPSDQRNWACRRRAMTLLRRGSDSFHYGSLRVNTHLGDPSGIELGHHLKAPNIPVHS